MLQVQQFQRLTGTEYVRADIACKYDKTLEKKPWNERLKAFEGMPIDCPNIYKTASNPIGLRAAIEAYKQAQAGNATGYMISLDAASSGLQLLSLMLSCPLSWRLCGGDENILDAYAELYAQMELNKSLDRKEVKQAIMTAFYGSKDQPEKIFGENLDVFYETLEKHAPGAWELNEAIQELWYQIDGPTYDWTMPDGFYACIETTEKLRLPVTFMDEEYTIIQEQNIRPRFHKGLGPNLVHSVDGMIVREMFRRCMYNPTNIYGRVVTLITDDSKKGGTNGKSAEMLSALWELYEESGFLSVRVLDHIYEDTLGLVKDRLAVAKLIQSLPAAPFQLVSVHDCFRSHPNYGNDIRRQYNHILADINDSNILEFIAQQVTKNPKLQVQKVGKIDRDVILNANYALS